MSVERRKARIFRKKLIWYFLYLFLLGLLVFSYYLFNLFKLGEFVSPLARGTPVNNKDIEEKLRDAKISYSEIMSNSDLSYIITSPLGGKIIITSQKNINKQISSLQRILRELTIKGKGFKTIDFRFEKPIVEFN